MPDEPRSNSTHDSHENFVVNHTATYSSVNFVVNPLGRLRSLDKILADTTDKGYPGGR